MVMRYCIFHNKKKKKRDKKMMMIIIIIITMKNSYEFCLETLSLYLL